MSILAGFIKTGQSFLLAMTETLPKRNVTEAKRHCEKEARRRSNPIALELHRKWDCFVPRNDGSEIASSLLLSMMGTLPKRNVIETKTLLREGGTTKQSDI